MAPASAADLDYMQRALALAQASVRRGNRAVASLIVRDGAVIGEGVNTVERDHDPSAHAEIAAIRDACSRLGVDLGGSTLYTTLEPCPMCLWCILEARVARLVLGGRYARLGLPGLGQYSVERFLQFTGRQIALVTGVLAEECERMRIEWMRTQSK